MAIKSKHRRQISCVAMLMAFVTIIAFCFGKCSCRKDKPYNASTNAKVSSAQADTLESFAKMHNLKISDYPDNLISLLDKNPETKDFVFNYPLKKDKSSKIDLSVCLNK